MSRRSKFASEEQTKENFFDRVEFIPFSGCWHWRGNKKKNGSGRFWGSCGNLLLAAHYSLKSIGGKSDFKFVKATCGNKDCVNPTHLEGSDSLSTPSAERFFDGILFIPFHECWEWAGQKDKDGYGYFWENNKTSRAHRFAVTLREPINKSLVVDHICRNRACVNPNHLRQVTTRFNVMENSSGLAVQNSLKTHCYRGHEFSEKNTYITTRGARSCRKCGVIKTKNWYVRNKNSPSRETKTI